MNTLTYYGTNTPAWWEDYFLSGKWSEKGGVRQSVVHMRAVLKVLADNNIEVIDKEVLDVGCATGEGTEVLYKAGASVIGADFCAQTIEINRRKYEYIGFIHADIREIRGWYDIIIANHILEHMGTETEIILRALKTVCDVLVVSVPSVCDHNPNHDGPHTGQVKTAYVAYPPTIQQEKIAIWMD